MTLDEAIKHCEEVAKEKGYEVQDCLEVHDMESAMECGKCGEEHEQLAEWLKDYKRLLEQKNMLFKSGLLKDCEFCKAKQDSILDKAMAEITDLADQDAYGDYLNGFSYGLMRAVQIIDKYKAAEELKMEKHTDRQIYDGCIHLIQKMVDYFQEYLEYLGIDKLDVDERFGVCISNMEIVRRLFLSHTRNSGGGSTRDFCEKLGVDPYKIVKFEFEGGEEE